MLNKNDGANRRICSFIDDLEPSSVKMLSMFLSWRDLSSETEAG